MADRGLNLTTCKQDDFTAWLDASPRCNRSRGLYVTRCGLLFGWMVDEGLRADNPTRKVPKPKFPKAVPRPLPLNGLVVALNSADPRTGLMLALAAYAGLRRAEIAGLTRENVLDDRDPPLLLIMGKGDKERLVPIGPVVARAMERYGLPARGPLFPGGCDGHLSPHTVGQAVSTHLRACGVDATTHQGRHFFGSQLYQVSGDIRMVQDMLGHASPATTAGYAQWAPDRAVGAVGALPAPWNPDGEAA